MSKQFARLMQHRMRRRKRDTAELAAQLAPLEEQDKRAAEQQGAQSTSQLEAARVRGAIVVDSGNLVLPKDVSESRRTGSWPVEPVVIVIVSLMLVFIAFIAWRITKMPPPSEKDESGRIEGRIDAGPQRHGDAEIEQSRAKGARYGSQGQALSAAKSVAPGTYKNSCQALKERQKSAQPEILFRTFSARVVF